MTTYFTSLVIKCTALVLMNIRTFPVCGKKIWENGTIEDLNSTGNDGRWKLIRLFELNKDPQKQLYLIASVKCPARFLYLAAGGIFTNAQAMVKVGDPGDQGYWYLDADGAVKAKVKPRPARGWFG